MKWVIFDAYGTLFNAGKFNLIDIAKDISVNYQYDMEKIFSAWTKKYIEIENDVNRGFCTITETNRESLSYVFEKYNFSGSCEKYVKQYIEYWSYPELIEGAKELIEWLKYKSCNIGMVTNSDNVTIRSAVENSGIQIANIVTSEMAQKYKPDPAIFGYALKKWSCSPENCIFIGNSINDIKAAYPWGMECIYIGEKDIDNYERATKVSSISDCKNMIEEFLCK